LVTLLGEIIGACIWLGLEVVALMRGPSESVLHLIFAYFYAHFVFKLMLLNYWGLVVPFVASRSSPIAMFAKATMSLFHLIWKVFVLVNCLYIVNATMIVPLLGIINGTPPFGMWVA
jgi:hypothetical protein